MDARQINWRFSTLLWSLSSLLSLTGYPSLPTHMVNMEHGAGLPYSIQTAPYTWQDCGNRSGYGMSLLDLLLFWLLYSLLHHCVCWDTEPKTSKLKRLIEVGILDYVLLLAFLVFIFFLYSLEIIAHSVASSQQRFEFWLPYLLHSVVLSSHLLY